MPYPVRLQFNRNSPFYIHSHQNKNRILHRAPWVEDVHCTPVGSDMTNDSLWDLVSATVDVVRDGWVDCSDSCVFCLLNVLGLHAYLEKGILQDHSVHETSKLQSTAQATSKVEK